MSDPAKALKELNKEKEFLVAIDSDGCVFDTMEIKHKECFIPNIINSFDLQAISKYAREAAEFVNLYSKSRGINRFPALVEAFDLLADRVEVQKRKFQLPEIDALRDWIKKETKLGNPALEELVAKTGDPVLTKTLQWSLAVNQTITDFVRGVPPFPFVKESLELMGGKADLIVVSATPNEALEREWEEHQIAPYVKVIAGQEMGSKAECLTYAKANGYLQDHVLMIGDAPGDHKAAQAAGALFYPINPGNEDDSWQRFYEEAYAKFLAKDYAGDYQAKLVAEFNEYLPAKPPWKE